MAATPLDFDLSEPGAKSIGAKAGEFAGKTVDATKAAMQKVASMSFNPFAAAPEAAKAAPVYTEAQQAVRAAMAPTAAEAERYAVRQAAQKAPGLVQGATRVAGNIAGGAMTVSRAIAPWISGAAGAIMVPVMEGVNTIRDASTLAGDQYGRGLVLGRVAEGVGRIAAGSAGAATGGAGGAIAADLAAVGAIEAGNAMGGTKSPSAAAAEIRADKAAGRVAANGELAPVYVDADVMAKHRANQAAKAAAAAKPAEVDITPARTVGGGGTGAVGAAGRQMSRAEILQDQILRQFDPTRLATLSAVDQEQMSTAAMGLQHSLATQAAQQLSAEAAWQHNITAERGQDMALMPHMGEIQRQQAIDRAIALGNLPLAHQIAMVGKPTEQPSVHVQAGDITSDTPAGAWVGGKFVPAPTKTEMRKQAERTKQIANLSTATTGVRG